MKCTVQHIRIPYQLVHQQFVETGHIVLVKAEEEPAATTVAWLSGYKLMDFSKFTYTQTYQGNIKLFFDFDIKGHTGHNKKTFDGYLSLISFLERNLTKKVYITKKQTDDFYEESDALVINIDAYQAFCKNLGRNGKNRAQAFFARKLKSYSDAEKKQIISTSTEEEIIERIKNFSKEEKDKFIEGLKSINGIILPHENLMDLSNEEFLEGFLELLKDKQKQEIIIANFPRTQIYILEKHKEFLSNNLDKNETFIQNWIDGKTDDEGNSIIASDEELKKIRKSRCLIFGLEFISHKTEGTISSGRFDVLTKLHEGKNEYVLIELKSPNSEVFKITPKLNINGVTDEYRLSDDTARAIPQISDYRNQLEVLHRQFYKGLVYRKAKLANA